MNTFLRGEESLASLLARFDVDMGEISTTLVNDMSLRDMSCEFIWAWCRAGEHFGRSKKLAPLLCDLLGRDDHECHEDLTGTLQNLRAPLAVPALYDRATRPLDYLAYNDGAALARRCVWALHDIGTAAAVARLADLKNDAREEVSGEASRRIEALQNRRPDVIEPYRRARDAILGSL